MYQGRRSWFETNHPLERSTHDNHLLWLEMMMGAQATTEKRKEVRGKVDDVEIGIWNLQETGKGLVFSRLRGRGIGPDAVFPLDNVQQVRIYSVWLSFTLEFTHSGLFRTQASDLWVVDADLCSAVIYISMLSYGKKGKEFWVFSVMSFCNVAFILYLIVTY